MATLPHRQHPVSFLYCLCVFLHQSVVSWSSQQLNVTDKDYKNLAEAVNSANSTWVADPSLANHSLNLISSLKLQNLSFISNWTPDLQLRALLKPEPESIAALPASYDLREHYPRCTIIGKIKFQSNCGSCWAVAAAGSLADRMCIASNGRQNHELSIDHVLTCCSYCTGADGPCAGGDPLAAWIFMKKQGVPTGGMYATHVGCKPYRIAPCSFPGYKPCKEIPESSLKCTGRSCHNQFFKTPFYDNLFFAKAAYMIRPTNKTYPNWHQDLVNAMKYDIFKYGSIVAGMELYEDFSLYSQGVYQHVSGQPKGGHAVKLIGWGKEKNVSYWLAVNSWSKYWGEAGTFKIRQGTDECSIETFQVSAGLFDLDRSSEIVDFVYDYQTPSSTADRRKGLLVIILAWSIAQILLNTSLQL